MLSKTDNGRWKATVYVAPGKRATKRFDTKAEAKQWEAEKLKSRVPDLPRDEHRTIAEVVERFRETRFPNLRPKSRKKYEQILRHFTEWCEASDLRHIQMLTDAEARAFEAHVRAHWRGKGAVVMLQTVKAVFRSELSRVDRSITRSPFEEIKLRQPPRKDVGWLTAEDLALILKQCTPKARAAFSLLANTGMRRDELRHLRWSEVRGSTLHVKSTSEFTTKSGKDRKVPLNAAALEALAYLRTIRTGDYVFPATDNRPTAINSLLVQLHRACRRASEESGRDFGWVTLHTLRKTFATRMLYSSVPLGIISRLLGHATIATTEHYLGDVTEDDASWAVARIG